MDISQMSLEQLKALAFDEIRQRDTHQANLNIILAQIERLEKEKNGNQ